MKTGAGGALAVFNQERATDAQVSLWVISGFVVLTSLPVGAQTVTDPGVELAFMPRTMSVTLLNEGGKYVVIDLKHIPQGGTCRMDKDATILRVGPGVTEGTIRVRYAAPQLSSGGCPFLTEFDLPAADYNTARVDFVQKEEEAS